VRSGDGRTEAVQTLPRDRKITEGMAEVGTRAQSAWGGRREGVEREIAGE